MIDELVLTKVAGYYDNSFYSTNNNSNNSFYSTNINKYNNNYSIIMEFSLVELIVCGKKIR